MQQPALWLDPVCMCESCLTLCDPMDCSLQGSSVHWISQARILEWAAISSSRGSSWPRMHLLRWWADSLPLHLGIQLPLGSWACETLVKSVQFPFAPLGSLQLLQIQTFGHFLCYFRAELTEIIKYTYNKIAPKYLIPPHWFDLIWSASFPEYRMPHSWSWTPSRGYWRLADAAALDLTLGETDDKCPWQVSICGWQETGYRPFVWESYQSIEARPRGELGDRLNRVRSGSLFPLQK